MAMNKDFGAFDFIAVKIGTLEEVKDWFRSIEALKGSVISVETDQNDVDDRGVHDHLVIVETPIRRIEPRIYPGESTKTHRGEIQIVGIVLRENEEGSDL